MPESLRVWAPQARTVEIVYRVDGSLAAEPMAEHPDGWWSAADTTHSSLSFDYAFRIDGGAPWPDPRSPWQPDGVHGFSRTVDPATFAWTDHGWPGPRGGRGILGALHYELHVGTFTPEGTLDAASRHLPSLVDLGVDVVLLMPVAAFPGRWGWGYDAVAPYAVHQPYGGPAALVRFVDAAHRLGLGVALDVVYNHLGPVGNYLAGFGPYYSTRHTTPWGPALNLDGPGSAEVRRWVLDNAARWLRDFHVDELRLDAVHALHDDSPRHLLAELSDEIAALAVEVGRPLALVAETDRNEPATVAPVAQGGLGLTAQWADDVHHAIHVALTGETQGYYGDFADPSALATTLSAVFLHDGRYSSFRGRPWGRPVDRTRVDGRRFLVFLQSHDQVGNRAQGDRIGAALTPGQQAIGAALSLLGPGTPMVFMGQEWSASTPWQYFTDFDPAEPVAAAIHAGRQAEFAGHGWIDEVVPDPQDPATRAASVLDWAEPDRDPHARMLGWYRDLVRLRAAEPELDDGRLDAVRVEGGVQQGWLTMRRGAILVAVTFAPRPTAVPVGPDGDGARLLVTWAGRCTGVEGGLAHLDGHDVAVLRLPPPR